MLRIIPECMPVLVGQPSHPKDWKLLLDSLSRMNESKSFAISLAFPDLGTKWSTYIDPGSSIIL